MINPRSTVCVAAALAFLLIPVACTATPITTTPSIATALFHALTPSPTIAVSATPTSVFSAFPILSPTNASDVTEVVRLTKGIIGNAIWSPDGKSITVSTSAGVYLYNATNGEELLNFNTAPSPEIAISFDGKLLATGEGAIVRIWELETGQEIISLNIGGKKIQHLMFSPDNRTLAVDSIVEHSQGKGETPELRAVQVWNVTTAELLYSLLARQEPAFSPDGDLLAVFYDGNIEFWDAIAGQLLNSVQGDWQFTFNPNGDSIAVQVSDPSLPNEALFELLDIQTWQTRCKLGLEKSFSFSLSFSPDGKQFAASTTPGTAQVWDTESCQKLYAISGHEGYVNLAFSPNDRILASFGLANRTLKLWDIVTGKLQGTLEEFYGDPGNFSPNGKLLIERQWFWGTISIWDLDTGKPVLTLDKHTDNTGSIAFSPDGRSLATGHTNGVIHIWSVESSEVEKTIPYDYNSYVNSIAFSPNGQIIASGKTGGKIELWDVLSGKSLLTFKGHAEDSWVTELAFSPEGKTLVSRASDSSVRLWDVETGQVKFAFILVGSTNESGIAFSPDGSVIAIATSDKLISLWNVNNGQLLFKLFVPTDSIGASKLAFSPDGHTLIASGYSAVWIWDLATKNLLATLENAGNNIASIALTPDGKLLAVSGWAGIDKLYEINLWDIESQKQLTSLIGHTGWIRKLAFSPDGRLLASGSVDGTVRLWGIKP